MPPPGRVWPSAGPGPAVPGAAPRPHLRYLRQRPAPSASRPHLRPPPAARQDRAGDRSPAPGRGHVLRPAQGHLSSRRSWLSHGKSKRFPQAACNAKGRHMTMVDTNWRLPAEWHPQDWLWIGFPHDAGEWPGFLEEAQVQIAAFASAVAESGQAVRLVVRDKANAARARVLASSAVTIEQRVYGDVWLRDTGPLVVIDGLGGRRAQRFAFNGWGGKYLMDGDQTI